MRLALLLVTAALGGCATLHHAQVDEIDASRGRLVPFEIHASEVGINAREVGRLVSATTRNGAGNAAANLVALFQYGPKTGDPVLDDTYADALAQEILARCPTGRVTGLVSMRETTKIYAVSGEYVTVRGFCIVD
jgi:hypothetical protein